MIGGKKRIGLGIALLLLVALANRLWFIVMMPLTPEELYSQQHFIGPGLLTAITSYASPNNHVLNSVLSSLMVHLPLSDAFALRTVAMLASLASGVVVFFLVLQAQSARFAFFSAGIWMASLSALYYGAVGRGHALVALFALLAYHAMQQLLNDTPHRLRWSAVFIVASGLGFWAVPTFLLPFSGLVLCMIVHQLMHRDKAKFTLNVINTLLATLLAGVLYLPILLNNRIVALTDHWMMREYDLGNFTLARIVDHAQEVLTFFDPLVAALFIPLAGIAIWLQKGWKGGFMTQALLMFAVSFAYVGFSGTIPPAHTLVFLTPFVIMAVSEGLYNGYTQVSQIYRKGMMVLIALLPILVLVNSNRTMYRTNLHPATQESAAMAPTGEGAAAGSSTLPTQQQPLSTDTE
jgi:hypothetical protein